MELGRAPQRILRALLLRGSITRGAVTQALYIDHPEKLSGRGREGGHYVLKLMRDLAEALLEQGIHLNVSEWRADTKGPLCAVAWSLSREPVTATERWPAPLGGVPPRVLEACRTLPAMASAIVQHLAVAGTHGLNSQQLVRRLYPIVQQRPPHATTVVSNVLGTARGGLARHHLRVVMGPTRGPGARRYLVGAT